MIPDLLDLFSFLSVLAHPAEAHCSSASVCVKFNGIKIVLSVFIILAFLISTFIISQIGTIRENPNCPEPHHNTVFSHT